MDKQYYLNQMNYFKNKIDGLEKKQEKIKNLENNIRTFIVQIEQLYDKFNESKNQFKDGAFSLDEESFDDGALEECCNRLNSIRSTVNALQNEISLKKTQYIADINSNKNNYNTAVYNYRKAMVAEND